MDIKKKRALLIGLALVISIACAFAIDLVVFNNIDSSETIIEEKTALFTDGHEASGFYSCEIVDKRVLITGPDPQFVIPAGRGSVNAVQILFSEPTEQDTILQIFFSLSGEPFSEQNSVRTTIASGTKKAIISIPENVYSLFRFDFEQSVSLDTIDSGKEIIDDAYHPNAVRIILLAVEVFGSLCLLIFSVTGRKKDQDKKSPIFRDKPLWTVLLCNLFLMLTIAFFQPITEIIVQLENYPYLIEKIWWIQFLLAILSALILSILMLLLPARFARTTASLSLSTGVSFLAQSLLWNDLKPFQMNTNWPMEMLNFFVWFGIIIITVTMVATYSGKEGKKIQTAMCVAACLLIVVQGMSFTVLGTTKKEKRQNILISQEETQHSLLNMEEDIVDISITRGMPFFLKNSQ